jgi:hypothetical protein
MTERLVLLVPGALQQLAPTALEPGALALVPVRPRWRQRAAWALRAPLAPLALRDPTLTVPTQLRARLRGVRPGPAAQAGLPPGPAFPREQALEQAARRFPLEERRESMALALDDAP